VGRKAALLRLERERFQGRGDDLKTRERFDEKKLWCCGGICLGGVMIGYFQSTKKSFVTTLLFPVCDLKDAINPYPDD
jgi:hypothetical protein